MSASIGIAGPIWAAIGLITVAAGGAYAGVTSLPFTQGTYAAEFKIMAPGVVDVRAGDAAVDRVLVVIGQRVNAGEVIAQSDSSEIDREIGALREQSDRVQKQLESVRVETQSFNILQDQELVSRTIVTGLEGRLADLESSARALMGRIQDAENRLFRAVVRAPVTGTVIAAPPQVEGRPFRPGEVIVKIQADPDRIVLEGDLSPALVAALRASPEARVWLGPASLLHAQPLRVRLTWLAPQDNAAGATAASTPARATRGLLELDQARSAPGGRHVPAPGHTVTVFSQHPAGTLPDMLLQSWRRNIRLPPSVRVHGDQ